MEIWALLNTAGGLAPCADRREARSLVGQGTAAIVRIRVKKGTYVPFCRKPDDERRARIRVALKRARARDLLSLPALASIYGVSKARFVNLLPVLRHHFRMPRPSVLNGAHFYPAGASLRAMLAYETRDDGVSPPVQYHRRGNR